MYDEICIKTFLENQEKLFDDKVAETMEEAEQFLEDCMAPVLEGIDEVRAYFEENMDVCDLSDEELEDELEVFKLPDGRYLIVEG